MSKTKNLFDIRMEGNDKIHKELFNKEKKALEEKLRDKKYETRVMIENSSLGGTYHNLINEKDDINSELHSQLNKGLHTVDVELYKLNKNLDNKKRMVDYKINQRIEQIEQELKQL